MMGSHSSRKARSYLVIALMFPCLVIAGAWYLAYNSVHQIDDAIGLVDHTFSVRAQIKHLRQLFVDAETGERGFVLTSDRLFLDPYFKSIAVLPAQIEKLSSLAQAEPLQQQVLEKIKEVSQRKLDWMARSVAKEEAGAHAEVTRMIASGEGKVIMDELRDLLANVEEAESARFSVHKQQLLSHAKARTHLLFFLLVLNLIFAAGIYYVVNRLRKLQGFVKICAWSRTIEFEGEWMSFEAYLYKRFGLETSHGVSPQELEKFEENLSGDQAPGHKK